MNRDWYEFGVIGPWLLLSLGLGIGLYGTMATGDEPWPVYRYPGIAPVTVAATGRYQVRMIDGKWWFVDPAGHAFLFIGVNGVGPRGAPDARRQFPYRKLVMQKYRNLDRWAESAAQRLRQWGFNAHATGHLGKENEKDAIRRQPLWFAHLVMFGELFWRKNGDILMGNKDKWQSVPNFFRPDYETFCDEMAHRLAAKLCRNPWFIGFMLDNERNWEGPVPFTRACWQRPAADPAKRAFVDFARRYTRGKIDRFNQIWGTGLESFEELYAHRSPPAGIADDASRMCSAFFESGVERFIGVAAAACRKYAPDRLILGIRQHLYRDLPELWRAMGKYCDVITFNCYPRIDRRKGVYADLIHEWERIHRWSQRPLMISEWSFPSLDSGLPCTRGAGMRVQTQEERARCFRLFQECAFSLPYVVGTMWFCWVDQPADGSFENTNYGLVKIDDTPWEKLTRTASAVNRRLGHIHREGKKRHIVTPDSLRWNVPLPENRCGDLSRFAAERIRVRCGDSGVDVSYNNVPMGQLSVMVMKRRAGRSSWERPDNVRWRQCYYNDAWLAGDLVMSKKLSWELKARLWVPRTKASRTIFFQVLAIRNLDPSPWQLARIFHAFYPAIGGTWAGDRLIRGCVGVEDAKAGYAVRYVPVSPVLRGHWWCDEQNRLHPDIYMGIDETMTPGRMITFSAGLFPSCHLFYRLDSENGSRLEASLIAQFRVAGEHKGEEP